MKIDCNFAQAVAAGDSLTAYKILNAGKHAAGDDTEKKSTAAGFSTCSACFSAADAWEKIFDLWED